MSNMSAKDVQDSITHNLMHLIEEAPTDDLRDLAAEVKADLESLEVTTCYAKFVSRGKEIHRRNGLVSENARMKKELARLRRQLENIRMMSYV